MGKMDITNVEGFRFGNAENQEAATGCTVMICEEGAVAGVSVLGGAPGTRETDLLQPENMVEKIHCVFLAGGSAFGLDSASGIMTFLEEKGIGFDVSVTHVPIVPGAILFDLTVGLPHIRPDAEMGRLACEHAYLGNSFKSGNYGAGTGASVGKLYGPECAMKGGLGSFALKLGDVKLGAVIAVNSFGDVINPETGEILAGLLKNGEFLNTEKEAIRQMDKDDSGRLHGNTTIGTIITNVDMTKSQAKKIASIAHDGIARTIRPSHTFADGDTLFCMSSSRVKTDVNIVASLAAFVAEKAIINAVTSAKEEYDLPAYESLF